LILPSTIFSASRHDFSGNVPGKSSWENVVNVVRIVLLGRQSLSGKEPTSQLEGWMFDPRLLSELP